MWRALLCKYVLRIRYNVELADRLRSSSKLREICGFGGSVPSESTFSRFFSRLTHYQPSVERCLTAITDRIGLKLPNFGKLVAIDSTAVVTYGNPNRRTKLGDPCGDVDARWGVKHSSKVKEGNTAFFFGYKLHTIADALYGIPLGFTITPGNEVDVKHLRPVVRKVRKSHGWFQPKFLLGDKGYDSTGNHRFLMNKAITPVIHMRRPGGGGGPTRHQGIYSDEGSPTCFGSQKMEYVRTDPKTGHHLFRCPAGGCHLKSKSNWDVRYCDQEIWEDPALQPRIVGVLPRASPLWKKLYKRRTAIERVFRSLKHSRNLETHCFREIQKVALHATLSVLTYSATVLARLSAGDTKKMRLMRVNAP